MSSGPAWDPAEDEIILEHYAAEGPAGVAQRLASIGYKRTPTAVATHIAELRQRSGYTLDGVKRARGHRWSPAERAIVIKHYPRLGPAGCLALLREAGSDCSLGALRTYAVRQGLRAPRTARRNRADGERKASKLLVAVNPDPLDPVLATRLRAIVVLIDMAQKRCPWMPMPEVVRQVITGANRAPDALDAVVARISL